MEGHTMQGGLPASMDAPKFQAYLRQQLIFEHQRVSLARSRRNWRMTALVAVAVCVVSIARPGIPHRARESMAVLLGSPHGQPDVELAYRDDSVPLEHALAASLAQDRALARRLGSGHVLGARAPEHTFVVSRFPISGGRAVSIYTPLSSPRQDGENDVVFAHDGGVW